MTRSRIYRFAIVVALMALTGLLVVQVYWFVRAYHLQERQFDDRVNVALREVADQLLRIEGDNVSGIAPVKRIASNAYHVDFSRNVNYEVLDSVLRIVFQQHQILSAFELAVSQDMSNEIVFGNFYKQGVMSKAQATCLKRSAPENTPMDFVVTFTSKNSAVVGSMGIWIFSALTFIVILLFFGYMIIDLSRQKKVAQVKADFINNMTHELQTPITNISLASEVLRKSAGAISQEKSAHYVDIIHVENQRLKRQVEQVLQTAMLEKGQIELNKTEVNLNSIVTEVVNNFQIRVKSRQGRIKSQLDATQPVVFGDPFHLTNILYSLLDNADKYSFSNPDITITTANTGEGVFVAVADKGIGISRDVQRFIFDKFYRAAQGDVHDVKGFGLGLTYVREIVKAHQGKVSVVSEVDNGSVFQLYFQNA